MVKKVTCAGVRRMRGEVGVVFTPCRLQKESPLPVSGNTLTLGLKEREISVHPNSMPATIFQMISTHDQDELGEAAERHHLQPVLGSTLSEFLHCAKRKFDLVGVELAHWDGVLCYLCLDSSKSRSFILMASLSSSR